MGCEREGFDLFTKWGWRAFWRSPRRALKYNREYIWKDTLGHHICAVIGHSERTFQTEVWDENQREERQAKICLRCFKRVAWVESNQLVR